MSAWHLLRFTVYSQCSAGRRLLGRRGPESGRLRREDSGGAALRRLPAVARALSQAREQVQHYRAALAKRETGLDLRGYVVVAVGLERMLGEEIPG